LIYFACLNKLKTRVIEITKKVNAFFIRPDLIYPLLLTTNFRWLKQWFKQELKRILFFLIEAVVYKAQIALMS